MPAASAISCRDVRSPEDAISDAAVSSTSVRRVPSVCSTFASTRDLSARADAAASAASGECASTTTPPRRFTSVIGSAPLFDWPGPVLQNAANQSLVRGYQTNSDDLG